MSTSTRQQGRTGRAALLRIAGGEPVGAAARWVFRNRLRVLAYHDVQDADAFEAQVRHLVSRYEPVTGHDVAEAVREGATLPDNAVWVTFDDGSPTVVERAQPVLDRHGLRATLFVCPGLVDTDRPFWWTVVRTAVELGVTPRIDGRTWTGDALVTELKARADDVRRAIVAELDTEVDRRLGSRLTTRQLRREELAGWLGRGHELGNHTWDHPCLDRCTPASQRRQIRDAQCWLAEHFPGADVAFAYPNGNWSSVAEAQLHELGYPVALGFDHRLATMRHPLRLSRLRVSADAPVARFAAIASGVHATAFSLSRRARGRGNEVGRTDPPVARRRIWS